MLKLGNLKFGLDSLNVVANGVKTSSVVTEPQLTILTTKGGFNINSTATRAIGLEAGDSIIFLNNIDKVEAAIAARTEDIMNIASENELDLDNPDHVDSIKDALTMWFVAKGYALKTKTGNPIMVTPRLSEKDKKELFDNQVDEIVANNREDLIEKFELSFDASDNEIKSHLSINDVELPKVQSYAGAKLYGNIQGVGVKLNFSDSSIWEQLKADMEDKTAMKRIYNINIANKFTTKFNNGYKMVDVVVYPLGEYTDEKSIRVKKEVTE